MYVNGVKVMDSVAVEDCPVFKDVNVKSGHGDLEIPKIALLRNFYLYNKFK